MWSNEMKYTISKTNNKTFVVRDENNLVVELSSISNYKLLGVLLKAGALTKNNSVVSTSGGAVGVFKEGLTQYELSGAKLYCDITFNDGSKQSLPYFKGKFYLNTTTLSFENTLLHNHCFRAVI